MDKEFPCKFTLAEGQEDSLVSADKFKSHSINKKKNRKKNFKVSSKGLYSAHYCEIKENKREKGNSGA